MKQADVFVRLDEFELDDFLRRALPALEALDALRLLELLCGKLERAIQASFLDEAETYLGYSSLWCRDLEQADPLDGTLAQVARAVGGIAVRASTGPERTSRVLAILDTQEHEIFSRIHLCVLAAAGRFVRPRLDAFFRDRGSLEPGCHGRETASVVREQFENASEDARLTFQRALEAGPTVHVSDGAAASPEIGTTEKRSWQRRRLLWFRDRIPASLRDLATQVGVTGTRPTPEQEQLAEDGLYSTGGFVVDRSPITADETSTRSPEDLVEYLVAWRPNPTSMTSPTSEGLARVLSAYAASQPAEAIHLAQLLSERLRGAGARIPAYLQGLLGGLRAAVEQGGAIDWAVALAFLRSLIPEVEAQIAREGEAAAERPWRWLATEMVDLLIAASRKTAVPLAEAGALWTIVDLFLRSESTWAVDGGGPLKSFDDVLTLGLNTAAGRATELLLEVALANFRQTLGASEETATDEQLEVAKAVSASKLRPLMRHVLAQSGRGAVAARAVIGTYVPQIHWLDRPWLVDAAPALFDSGPSLPLEHPAWGAYLTRAPMYDHVFTDLRTWYAVAAAQIPTTLQATSGWRGPWSLTQALASHVFFAYLRGLLQIDDQDHLLATVFALVPAVERAQVSWQIFRSCSDATEPVPPAMLERVVQFWRWRLEQLEVLPESDSKQEDVSGLTWLICTPYLPDEEVLSLGLRTVVASAGQAVARSSIWERLATLVDVDVDRTFRIAELLIVTAMDRPHPHITLEQTAPVLERALCAGATETRERATRLIHTLGERGFIEFGQLLPRERPSE
jgi:hypothetical protein